MSKSVKNLKKKISGCQFFIVLATTHYLKSIRDGDNNILTQITIARELNKPIFIIIDRRMSQDDTEEIRKYFAKDNVIKEIKVDIGDKKSAMIVASEIKHALACMFPSEDKEINVMAHDADEKD